MLEIEVGSFVVSWGWHALFLAYFLFWNFCYSLKAVVVAGFSGLWIHLALDSPIMLNLDCIIFWSYLNPQGILPKITSAFVKDFREGSAPSHRPKESWLGFLSTLTSWLGFLSTLTSWLGSNETPTPRTGSPHRPACSSRHLFCAFCSFYFIFLLINKGI